jgi:hypothetical protein
LHRIFRIYPSKVFALSILANECGMSPALPAPYSAATAILDHIWLKNSSNNPQIVQCILIAIRRIKTVLIAVDFVSTSPTHSFE